MFFATETAIQDWIRAASAPGAGVLGYEFQTVETYPQDWQERIISQSLACPAAFVTFAGFRAVDQTSTGAEVEATYGVAVVARNKRLGAAPRAGGPVAGEIGSVQLQEDVGGLLQGQDFGLDIRGLELIGGDYPDLSDEMVKQGISIFALQFKTRFSIAKGYFAPTAEFLGAFKLLQSEISQADDATGDLFNLTQTLQEEVTP